jgi:hypothetical protein
MINKFYSIFYIFLVCMLPICFSDSLSKNETMKLGGGMAAAGAGVLLGSYLLMTTQVGAMTGKLESLKRLCFTEVETLYTTQNGIVTAVNGEITTYNLDANPVANVKAVQSAQILCTVDCIATLDVPGVISPIPIHLTDPIDYIPKFEISGPILELTIKGPTIIQPTMTPPVVTCKPLPQPVAGVSCGAKSFLADNAAKTEFAAYFGTISAAVGKSIATIENTIVTKEAALQKRKFCVGMLWVGVLFLAAGAGTMGYAMSMSDKDSSRTNANDGSGYADNERSQAKSNCLNC